MAHKHKIATRLILAGLLALPVLASCGLRGGLARPDPIFKKVAPVAAAEPEATAPATVRESVIIRQNVNEFGGEIPDAAPSLVVESAPLVDPVSPDDEDE